MDKFYTLEVAGLTRQLPICKLNDEISIAGFVMFSDVEITVRSAEELLKRLKGVEFDYILTAESKGIPLAYEMSRQCGKKYLVARKKKKLYMQNPVEIEVQSITTEGMQHLYLDGNELALFKGKNIVIVDDVISTGASEHALEKIIRLGEGKIASICCVLAEGDAINRDDIIYLKELPLLKNEDLK